MHNNRLNHLRGSMVALVPPFANGRIDEEAFVQLCERQIRADSTECFQWVRAVAGQSTWQPSLAPRHQPEPHCLEPLRTTPRREPPTRWRWRETILTSSSPSRPGLKMGAGKLQVRFIFDPLAQLDVRMRGDLTLTGVDKAEALEFLFPAEACGASS